MTSYRCNTESVEYILTILMILMFTLTIGMTLTVTSDDDIDMKWTMNPVPPSSAIVEVLHPSGSTLFTTIGTSVLPAATTLGQRVTDANNTNTVTGHIEFTLTRTTVEDAGDYKTRFIRTGDSDIIQKGVTLIVHVKTIMTDVGDNKVIQWTMDHKAINVVRVLHPSGAVLFAALGTSVVLYSHRVTYTGNTDTSTGHIEFTLNDITVKDAGDYKVTYYGISDTGNRDLFYRVGVTLVVYVKPSKPILTGVGVLPAIGDTLTLNCIATSNSKPDNHTLQMFYTWYRNGAELLTDDRYNVSGPQLQVKNISRSDTNEIYSCEAFENETVSSDISDDYTVSVKYAPGKVVLQPSNGQYLMLKNATPGPINCTADCTPPCKYWWVRNNENVTHAGVLYLDKMQCYQSGVYSCIAWNDQGSQSSDIVVLDSIHPPILIRAECNSGNAELLFLAQKYLIANLHVLASTDGLEFNKLESAFIYTEQSVIIGTVYGLHSKTTYFFKVISTSEFGMTESHNNQSCTTPDSTQNNDGKATFHAGIAMIAISLVIVVLSTVITGMLLHRTRAQRKPKSKVEDIGLKKPLEKTEQEDTDHYQEMGIRSCVYQDLDKKDLPTVYEQLETKEYKCHGMYMNTEIL